MQRKDFLYPEYEQEDARRKISQFPNQKHLLFAVMVSASFTRLRWLILEIHKGRIAHVSFSFNEQTRTEKIKFIRCKEWHLADHKYKQYDAAGPDVGRLTVDHLLFDKIRAHVVRSATLHSQLLILPTCRREPIINDLNFIIFCVIYQDVVQL